MTASSLRVSVPVLSAQITVVDPSVSTAARRRTMARRAAIRCIPTARAAVIATGSPSGTIETSWLTATMRIVANGSPRTSPTTTMTTKRTRAATVSQRPSCEIRRSRGVAGSGASRASEASWPSSVADPVATTTARPRPLATWVPEKTTLERSATAASSATGAGAFGTGSDSPVSAASATRSPAPSTTRASAAMASPAARTRRSPGTTSRAATVTSTPSRTTRARGAERRRRAAIERSARPSWNAPRIAFATSTTPMTTASLRSPMTTLTAAATTRR